MDVTDYADLYKGGITAIYTDDASGTAVVDRMSYYSLPSPGTNENWATARWIKYNPTDNAPMTPVLKIDLSKYHNWHIVKD